MAAGHTELWQPLLDDFATLSDWPQTIRLGVRLIVAMLLGGILGLEREKEGKSAGMRTHMMVCLGAALFVITPQYVGMKVGDLSRVIQGVAAGMGFIGGGVIIKISDQGQIRGLTTAAGIWLTSAIGMAVGMGRYDTALAGLLLALVILTGILRLEQWFDRRDPASKPPAEGP